MMAESNPEQLVAPYRILAQALPSGALLLFDKQLRCLLAGGPALVRLGARADSAEGQNLDQAFPSELVQRLRPVMLAALQGAPGEIECPTAHLPLWLQVFPLVAPAGRLPVVVVHVQEVRHEAAEFTAVPEDEHRFRSIVEQLPEMICRVTADGSLLYANDAFVRAFGLIPLVLEDATFLDCLPQESRANAREIIHALTPDQSAAVFEVLQAGATNRWHEWTVQLIADATGRATEYQAVGRDISDRKRIAQQLQANRDQMDDLEAHRGAEHTAANYQLKREILERRKTAGQLRASEERLRQIINLIPHLVFAKDAEGRFLLVNDALASMYRASSAQITGALLEELHSHMPGEADRFMADDREVIATNQEKFVAREPFTDARGRLHWLQVTKIPFTIHGTQVPAVLGVGVDVSEQERTLQTLRRRDAILQAISFSAERFLGEGDWNKNIAEALGALGAAAEVSRVYIFQNGRDESGRRTMTQIHEWTAPEVSAELHNPQMQQVTYDDLGFERWEQILGEGKIIYGNIVDFPASERALLSSQDIKSIAAVPVYVSGHFWGFFGVDECREERVWSAAELDALKVAANTFAAALRRKQVEEERLVLEAQIQQTQKLESLGVLAGGVAHDFNNLLMAILGNANLALMDLAADAPARHSIERIELAAQRAAELTRQMLAYSGKGKFLIEPIQLSTLVHEMLRLLTVSLPKKVQLELDLPEDLPHIKGDVTQIRQVVMNLITNAAEAIDTRPGTLRICTRGLTLERSDMAGQLLADDLPAGPYVELTVEDSGCGMDPETLQRIFDPFFTTKFAGRGLGLAAVLGIVRSHFGGLRVQSGPGTGTAFHIYFPVSHEHQTALPMAPSKQWAGAGIALVVDDEAQVRDVAKQMIERAGYEVDVAGDGVQALARIQETPHRYAFVLLDLNMPHMGGEEALQHIRKISPQLPVLLSSGYDEGELSEQLTLDPNLRFIQKPYRRHELVERLEELLNFKTE